MMSRSDVFSLDALADAAFAPVSAALERIPGAALGFVTAVGERVTRHGGCASLQPERIPLGPDTFFDLASLTKPMVTTTAILRLVEDGRLDLGDPLGRVLPDLRQYTPEHGVRALTVRQLLSHQSGLHPVEPIYTWGSDPATLKALILHRDWPLAAPAYSDINFLLLGLIVERLWGCEFRALPVAELLRAGDRLTFTPDPMRSAATEACPWRGRVIRGEVHDENAYALGGAAGHAGLFGTLDGVLDFVRALLQGEVLGPGALAEMRRPQSATRTLGWECRHPGWTGGSLTSPRTIGHTGFTGTGLWVDFDRGFAWALLTNRVHPSRHRETGIQELRRSVGNILGRFS